MGGEEIIKFENVSKYFDGKPAVRNLSFSVKKGESLAIIGSSGSGKTTVLKIILCLIEHDEGRVKLFGKDLSSAKEADLFEVRSRTGMVFQLSALFDSLTVWENIAMPLIEEIEKKRRLTKDDMREIDLKVKRILDMLDLEGTQNKMPSELSGGMMRRVAIARALVKEPELILYDEPTVGLDPITAEKLTTYVLGLHRRLKVTSIVVTHDLRFARKTTERIIMLVNGEKTFEGSWEEFMKSTDEYVRLFRETGL